ncbi:hypothetical protein STEG23_034482, partial [Scotinomys teguina]
MTSATAGQVERRPNPNVSVLCTDAENGQSVNRIFEERQKKAYRKVLPTFPSGREHPCYWLGHLPK